MELTGKIELDKESTKKLEKSIRKKVVVDLNKEGLMWGEVEKYLGSLNMKESFSMLTKILKTGISAGSKQEEANDFHFDDEKKFKLLKALQVMIDLSEIR